MSDQPTAEPPRIQPKWKPIGRIERRVLGVLVEKAKTTPDAYPLTLNALTNGCNQKSNRDPQMNLEPYQIENALENLRHASAAMEIAGSGRVPKYRHLIYEWMGLEKDEAAVMAELLLRGAQTLGELRGRAARMGSIPDVSALQPIVRSLIDKGLVISLTPPGRGQVVTHALFLPEELEKVRSKFAVDGVAAGVTAAAAPNSSAGSPPSTATGATDSEGDPSQPTGPASTAPAAATPPPAAAPAHELAQLRQEVESLKAELARVKKDVQDLWANLS